MGKVYPANPYRQNALGSLGNADMMFLRQFNFPDVYDEKLDKLIKMDSDRCYSFDHKHYDRCYKQHVDLPQWQLEHWFTDTADDIVLEFIVDLLKVDKRTNWTGYRVLGTVGGNGHDIYSLFLFAKHPKSATVVYTGDQAPNIRP